MLQQDPGLLGRDPGAEGAENSELMNDTAMRSRSTTVR